MALQDYRRKRDFKKTPEPKANVARAGGKAIFVIQKHDATRLHYDFRLELGGVLRSWAVPKGPSLDPAVKSLAVQVEDHPIAYSTFEGIIPAGEYGGGTVIVWDHGTWEPESDDAAKAILKGRLTFTLFGEKLAGAWSLVRLHGSGEKKNWLLIKKDDESAIAGDGHGITDREVTSILTARDLTQVAADADRIWTRQGEKAGSKKANAAAMQAAARRTLARTAAKKPVKRVASSRKSKNALPSLAVEKISGAVEAKLPRDLSPQLAKLADQVPSGEQWLYELKFDGYRILTEIECESVRLITRNGNDWTRKFPSTAKHFASFGLESAVLDGELVALDERGVASFQRLQKAISDEHTEELVYYAFDAPYLNGFDLRGAKLLDRKQALAKLLLTANAGNDGPVRYSDHIQGHGGEVLEQSCNSALEGIVCKRADSLYESRRSDTWIKVKCHGRQEFIICGFTKPEGSRVGFGSLLLGYHDAGKLAYAGRVGTGFDHSLLAKLRKQLDAMVIGKSPFAKALASAERRGATFVSPELVAEIEFTEWTDDGHLRHPTFEGLREDKAAKDVVREKTQHSPVSSQPEEAPMKKTSKKAKAALKPGKQPTEVSGVQLTHPDRVLYADIGVTKRDLAEYYAAVADWILPHVTERPLSLVRCPDGSTGQCFYQKHWTETLPQDIGHVAIREKSGMGTYVQITDLAGLLSLVQISVLEVHPWGSKVDRLENPDRIVIDLDPGEDVKWPDVIQGAKDVRSVLDELELTSFVRTSGGKGLHVVVPLARRNSWDEVESFAHNLATGLSLHASDKYVANMRKALRKGRIYVDYLRNQRGSTAVASYSTRSRAACPVATPVTWKELGKVTSANAFTLKNVPGRLAKLKSDPWDGFLNTRQVLTESVRDRAGEFAKRR